MTSHIKKDDWYTQKGYDIRLEWGLAAAEHVISDVDCVVIVDVISFSTCVSLASDKGAYVYPWPWKDDSARLYAESIGGQAASIERKFTKETFSLSPASIQKLSQGYKLVLPSPNGSTISFKAKENTGLSIFSGCLRNMQATAKACCDFKTILVIPCGERWPDDSLRPALEDYVAAGGIIAAFQDRNLSPEARAAVAVYEYEHRNNFTSLKYCASAQELNSRGFAEDVTLCLEVNVSDKANQMLGDYYQGIN